MTLGFWLAILTIYLGCGVFRLVWSMREDGQTLAEVLQDAKDEYWPYEPEEVANSYAAIGLVLGILLWPYMEWLTRRGE